MDLLTLILQSVQRTHTVVIKLHFYLGLRNTRKPYLLNLNKKCPKSLQMTLYMSLTLQLPSRANSLDRITSKSVQALLMIQGQKLSLD